MKISLIFFLVILAGCDSVNQQTKKTADVNMNAAKRMMKSDDNISKDHFEGIYKTCLDNTKDSVRRLQILLFRRVIYMTENYLDTLIIGLDTLDRNNVRSIHYVDSLFIDRGEGDRVFNRITAVFQAAYSLSSNVIKKDSIQKMSSKIFNEQTAEKWKKEQFEMAGPMGASILIHIFKSQIFQVGEICLK